MCAAVIGATVVLPAAALFFVICAVLHAANIGAATDAANAINNNNANTIEVLLAEKVCAASNGCCTFNVVDRETTVAVDGATYRVVGHAVVFFSSTAVPTVGRGRRPPLVLVHGANSGPPFWFVCVPWLVRAGFGEIHCIALPGFGESPILDAERLLRNASTAGQMIRFMMAFMDDYIASTVSSAPVLVGHSFGGALVSAMVAARHQQCDDADDHNLAPVSGAILSNCPGIVPIFGAWSMYFAVMFHWGAPNVLARPLLQRMRPFWNSTVWLLAKVPHGCADLEWQLQAMASAHNIGHRIVAIFARATLTHGRFESNILPQLLLLRMRRPEKTTAMPPPPVSLIWGADDVVVPLNSATLLSSLGENGARLKLVRIPDCGHNPVAANDGRDFAAAVAECVSAEPRRFIQISRDQVARVAAVLESSSATWCRADTAAEIERMYRELHAILAY